MGDREVDQQLVERAQRGDKRAFELLVMKYQRKLGRLLSRMVRDPGEVEDGEVGERSGHRGRDRAADRVAPAARPESGLQRDQVTATRRVRAAIEPPLLHH